jgi:hypothetical protein
MSSICAGVLRFVVARWLCLMSRHVHCEWMNLERTDSSSGVTERRFALQQELALILTPYSHMAAAAVLLPLRVLRTCCSCKCSTHHAQRHAFICSQVAGSLDVPG